MFLNSFPIDIAKAIRPQFNTIFSQKSISSSENSELQYPIETKRDEYLKMIKSQKRYHFSSFQFSLNPLESFTFIIKDLKLFLSPSALFLNKLKISKFTKMAQKMTMIYYINIFKLGISKTTTLQALTDLSHQ